MASTTINRCAAVQLVLGCMLAATAVAAPPPALPPLMERLVTPLPPDGQAWFESLDSMRATGSSTSSAYSLVHRRWNPASGALVARPLAAPGIAVAAVRIPAGILFVHLVQGTLGSSAAAMYAALLQPDGTIQRGGVLVSRSNAQWTRLHDGSAVLFGGRGDSARSRAVEWVRWQDGALTIVRLPDHPGAGESAFAAVALRDGRVLLSGGSDGRYRGCMPCTAQTWLLDPTRGAWSAGPTMAQPRASHSASLLPDGSVLIAGGWTPREDWSAGPTRTTERWRVDDAGFNAGPELLNGSADHLVVPLPGDPRRLLLTGGTATTAQIFDAAAGAWMSAGAVPGSRDGSCHALPFRADGRIWLWQNQRSTPQYGAGDCGIEDALWSLRALHLPASTGTAATFAGGDGVMFDRAVAAFVPLHADRPALLIGGTAGEDARTQSAAVDAVFADGSVRPYPALVFARRAAFAVRLRDGVLVWGGSDGADNHTAEQRRSLPAEWLDERVPIDARRWLVLPTPPVQPVALGTDAAQRALLLGDRGEVLRVEITDGGDGMPRLAATAMPDLPVVRSANAEGERTIRIRGLNDGRIVIAGGVQAALRIAQLQPDFDDPSAIDVYVGAGPSEAAARHAIRDPVTAAWRESAPAQTGGGRVAILDDRRVFKTAAVLVDAVVDAAGHETVPAYWSARSEISDPDGSGWQAIDLAAASGIAIGNATLVVPFVLDGTLLVAAEGPVGIGGAPSIVLQQPSPSGPWQVLWSAREGDNWRAHVGRLVRRESAAGRPIVFPVAGE
jgi:hypothetical protein